MTALSSTSPQQVLVTGGAGYIGSVLVPKLLAVGHSVTVLDRFYFGRTALASVASHPALQLVEMDIRDQTGMHEVLARTPYDAVIHLAAISNDPSSDIDADLTRSVNLDALTQVMTEARNSGVGRFLYASSASVYGLKKTPDVTEELALEPLTLYARYKAEGEEVLNSLIDDDFTGVSVRAATVCGYSPRLRLDLTINILTHFAITQGYVRVFGGGQMRPNIHVQDLTDFYCQLLDAPRDSIQGESFNVSRENRSVQELAEIVRDQVAQGTGSEIPIEVVATDDNRSYSLSAEKVRRVLGFEPCHSLSDAVASLQAAYRDGLVADPADEVHRNVEWMKSHRDEWLGWRARALTAPA